jgi:isopenicillin N synthase-like dioxygenase
VTDRRIAVPFVPIVDISADPEAVAAVLDEICRTAGFFQVTGHGVPDDVAGPAWTLATRFFDLPLADKMAVAIAAGPAAAAPAAGRRRISSAAAACLLAAA